MTPLLLKVWQQLIPGQSSLPVSQSVRRLPSYFSACQCELAGTLQCDHLLGMTSFRNFKTHRAQLIPTRTAKCYDPNIFKNVGVFNSSINIATDLIFALIPIPMVWRLQVNMKTRIGLAVILSLGLLYVEEPRALNRANNVQRLGSGHLQNANAV